MSRRVLGVGRVTFAALAIPNYRRYIAGQSISLIGTWMQMAAQSWLVPTLIGSATTLGMIVALQTPAAGTLAGTVRGRDHRPRGQAPTDGCAANRDGRAGARARPADRTGAVRLWQIGALALLLGCSNAFENLWMILVQAA